MSNKTKIKPYEWPGISVQFHTNTVDKNDENYFDVKMEENGSSVWVNVNKSILRPKLEDENNTNENEKEIVKAEDEAQINFMKWRDSQLTEMNEFCNEVSGPRYRVIKNKNYGLKTIPKCMMHTSRKICNCKPECVENIWKDYKFDQNCKLYDLENFNTDDSYIDNCFPPRLNSNDVLEEVKLNPDQVKSEFTKELDELCNNSSLLSSTKCKAYQLRDECRNDSTCLKEDFTYNLKNNCSNKEYTKQVEDFEKILGIEFINKNEEMNINSNRKLLSIDDDVLYENGYNEDVILSRKNIAKNEMFVISSAGIAIICLLAIYKRNNRNSTIRTCTISAVLILLSLIFYSLTF